MSSCYRDGPRPSADVCLNRLYTDLFHLVLSVEKGSGSDLTLRLRNCELGIAQFKDIIKSLPDIENEESKQRKKIAALYKQIEQKDELLKSLASFSLEFSNNPSPKNPVAEAKTNESTYICSVCSTVIILKNMTTEWLDVERELPLPRQKKGIDHTQTEPVRGYYGVKDIFAFENAGFTRSDAGQRYLVCGECEQGPVGYVDSETQMNYIAPSRLSVAPGQAAASAVTQ